MNRLSIRVRLTMWYLSVISVTFVLAALTIYLGMRTAIQSMVDKELRDRTAGVHNFLWRHLPHHTREELPREFLEHSGIHPGGDLYQVREESGEWMHQAPFMPELNLPPELPNPQIPPRYSTITRQGNELRVLTSTVEVAKKNYLVQVVTVMNPLNSVLSRFGWIAVGMFPVVVCIAGLGGYWLSGRAMKPVHDIAKTAHGISEQNLSLRLVVPESGDELQHLSETLNGMLSRLQSAFLRVTQFTADASHELRTPVAVIRTTSELILSKQRSVAEYEELVAKIQTEAEATTELIENLLTLARADANATPIDLTSLDLAELVQESIASLQVLAHSREILLTYTSNTRSVRIQGNQPALRRLILILTDNAVKYTVPGGSVRLQLERTESHAVLSITDTGIGIAAADIPRIFERFYRASNARDLDVEGSGLGLSIAEWISAAHGAHIVVESEIGRGSTFRVQFPLRR